MTKSQKERHDQALERVRRAVRERDQTDDEATRNAEALAAEIDPTPPDDSRTRE